jgi:putative heme uptake system protein
VTAPAATPRVLLVWDAPNMDMSLGTLLGTRPTSAFRPRFDAVGRWLLELAGDEAVAEACVFTNVVPGATEVVRPWVEALRNVGFAVFAKPKITDDSDVDADMLAHIELRAAEGTLEHVVVASGDGRAFREPLEKLREDGTYVTVIGFREHASFALSSDVIEFVDLEEIEGVFREPLPRFTLDTLPEGGAWLHPFRPLRALLEPRR